MDNATENTGEVKRYNPTVEIDYGHYRAWNEEDQDGDYVKYSDYSTLKTENERISKINKENADMAIDLLNQLERSQAENEEKEKALIAVQMWIQGKTAGVEVSDLEINDMIQRVLTPKQ